VTPISTKWLPVTRESPCKICGRFQWCGLTSDGAAAICMRTESARPTRNGGFLHLLIEPRVYESPRRVFITSRSPAPDLTPLARQYQCAAPVDRLHAFAASLGLKTESMIAFGVGWNAESGAWAFPMTDPETGKVIGIRLRRQDGAKFSVKGGREGLFVPDRMGSDDEVLLILEGATDAIAAHGIGFPNAVGRPSCTGGTSHLVAMVKARKPSGIVVVADGDGPGTRGAETLARVLALHCRDVRVICPPEGCKDMRAWVATGATQATVERLIHAAEVRRATIRLKPNTWRDQ